MLHIGCYKIPSRLFLILPVIGTLLIQLPSEFSGGLIRVYDGEEGEEEDESKITCFGMGQSTGKSEYTCHFLCHYGDCQYEMQKI